MTNEKFCHDQCVIPSHNTGALLGETLGATVRLTWGPGHMPAAEQMQMQMMHRLSAVVSGVDHYAITILELLAARKVSCGGHQMTKQRLVFRHRLRLGCDVLFGNNEKVGRSLRINVGKSDAKLVLVDTICRYISSDDLAEKTFGMKFGRRTLLFHATFISRSTLDAGLQSMGCTRPQRPRG